MIAIYPKIIYHSQQKNIETLSCLVREYFGKNNAYAKHLNIKRLLENIGIKFVLSSDSKVLGSVICKDQKGAFNITIEINKQLENSVREKLMIAHLLGHYFLHIMPKIAEGEICDQMDYRETLIPILSNYSDSNLLKTKSLMKKEQEADFFGASLLLPKRYTILAYEKLNSLNEMASFFDMPEKVLKFRLQSLNIDLMQKNSDNITSSGMEIGNYKSKRNSKKQPPRKAIEVDSASESSKYKELKDPISKSENNLTKNALSNIRRLAKKIDSSVKL